eukprot:3876114-Amphidinium_carterae.1
MKPGTTRVALILGRQPTACGRGATTSTRGVPQRRLSFKEGGQFPKVDKSESLLEEEVFMWSSHRRVK